MILKYFKKEKVESTERLGRRQVLGVIWWSKKQAGFEVASPAQTVSRPQSPHLSDGNNNPLSQRIVRIKLDSIYSCHIVGTQKWKLPLFFSSPTTLGIQNGVHVHSAICLGWPLYSTPSSRDICPCVLSNASDPSCLTLIAIPSGTHGFRVTMARKKSWNVTHQLFHVSFQNVIYNFSSQTTGQIGHMVLLEHKEAGKYEDHMNSVRSTCLCHWMKLSIPVGLYH